MESPQHTDRRRFGAGTHIFAGATSTLVYQGQSSNPSLPQLNRFGGMCDTNGNDEVTLDGALTNQTATSGAVAFALTENGALGSFVINAKASTDGSSILDGAYSSPASCGFPEDLYGPRSEPRNFASCANSGFLSDVSY